MKSLTPRIKFNILYPFTFPSRRNFKLNIQKLIEAEGFHIQSIDYIFCNDDYLLKINQDYLNHNDLTDIITFDLSDKQGDIISEIYISIERVKENASTYGVPFLDELRRVMYHGVLHLCGYKDKTPADQKQMRKMESYYMNLLP